MQSPVLMTFPFIDTFLKMNGLEQKMVMDAIQTWIKNPQGKGSNFEKLQHVGDNIYSIRANDAWRIIMAKFDNAYFVLHTSGQHDKTNNWARGKRIDRNAVTGAIQIYSMPVEELEEAASMRYAAPVEKGPFAVLSREDLLLMGVPEIWVDAVKAVETEQQYLALWDVLPQDALEHLFLAYEKPFNIAMLLAQIKDEIAQKPETLIEQARIQPGFYVLGEDDSVLEELQKDINVFRFYLHPAQRFLATSDYNGSMKVTGSAGTGKTVVALHRAKYLVGELQPGDQPVLFTTFSRHLINNIKALFATQGFSEEQLRVDNLHSFAVAYSKQLGLLDESTALITGEREIAGQWNTFTKAYPHIQLSAAFLREEYETIIQQFQVESLHDYLKVPRTGRGQPLNANARTSVWNALQAYGQYRKLINKCTFDDVIFELNTYLAANPDTRPFSHVICDEIQDFNNLEMRLLRNLVGEKPNDLFLCGDPFQNIYQRRMNFSQSGIQIRGKKSARLRINYRTTEEIRQYAVEMLKGYIFQDFSGEAPSMEGDKSIFNGNEPQYVVFENSAAFHRYLLDYIRTSFGQLSLHEICITARTNKAVTEIEQLLTEAKFPVINLSNMVSINDTEGKVVVGSMHSLKGLEFKNLIVTGFDQSSFPLKPNGFAGWPETKQQAYLQSEHALYYVVFSRAISQLVVTGIGEKVVLA